MVTPRRTTLATHRCRRVVSTTTGLPSRKTDSLPYVHIGGFRTPGHASPNLDPACMDGRLRRWCRGMWPRGVRQTQIRRPSTASCPRRWHRDSDRVIRQDRRDRPRVITHSSRIAHMPVLQGGLRSFCDKRKKTTATPRWMS